MSLEKPSFGLEQSEVKAIIEVLSKHPEVEKAVVFGSRALDRHKPGSDIDLAIFGQISDETKTAISYTLNEETLLPYFFDIVAYQSITNSDLKDHIDRVGKILFRK